MLVSLYKKNNLPTFSATNIHIKVMEGRKKCWKGEKGLPLTSFHHFDMYI
jgi:hypothetical protein